MDLTAIPPLIVFERPVAAFHVPDDESLSRTPAAALTMTTTTATAATAAPSSSTVAGPAATTVPGAVTRLFLDEVSNDVVLFTSGGEVCFFHVRLSTKETTSLSSSSTTSSTGAALSPGASANAEDGAPSPLDALCSGLDDMTDVAVCLRPRPPTSSPPSQQQLQQRGGNAVRGPASAWPIQLAKRCPSPIVSSRSLFSPQRSTGVPQDGAPSAISSLTSPPAVHRYLVLVCYDEQCMYLYLCTAFASSSSSCSSPSSSSTIPNRLNPSSFTASMAQAVPALAVYQCAPRNLRYRDDWYPIRTAYWLNWNASSSPSSSSSASDDNPPVTAASDFAASMGARDAQLMPYAVRGGGTQPSRTPSVLDTVRQGVEQVLGYGQSATASRAPVVVSTQRYMICVTAISVDLLALRVEQVLMPCASTTPSPPPRQTVSSTLTWMVLKRCTTRTDAWVYDAPSQVLLSVNRDKDDVVKPFAVRCSSSGNTSSGGVGVSAAGGPAVGGVGSLNRTGDHTGNVQRASTGTALEATPTLHALCQLRLPRRTVSLVPPQLTPPYPLQCASPPPRPPQPPLQSSLPPTSSARLTSSSSSSSWVSVEAVQDVSVLSYTVGVVALYGVLYVYQVRLLDGVIVLYAHHPSNPQQHQATRAMSEAATASAASPTPTGATASEERKEDDGVFARVGALQLELPCVSLYQSLVARRLRQQQHMSTNSASGRGGTRSAAVSSLPPPPRLVVQVVDQLLVVHRVEDGLSSVYDVGMLRDADVALSEEEIESPPPHPTQTEQGGSRAVGVGVGAGAGAGAAAGGGGGSSSLSTAVSGLLDSQEEHTGNAPADGNRRERWLSPLATAASSVRQLPTPPAHADNRSAYNVVSSASGGRLNPFYTPPSSSALRGSFPSSSSLQPSTATTTTTTTSSWFDKLTEALADTVAPNTFGAITATYDAAAEEAALLQCAIQRQQENARAAAATADVTTTTPTTLSSAQPAPLRQQAQQLFRSWGRSVTDILRDGDDNDVRFGRGGGRVDTVLLSSPTGASSSAITSAAAAAAAGATTQGTRGGGSGPFGASAVSGVSIAEVLGPALRPVVTVSMSLLTSAASSGLREAAPTLHRAGGQPTHSTEASASHFVQAAAAAATAGSLAGAASYMSSAPSQLSPPPSSQQWAGTAPAPGAPTRPLAASYATGAGTSAVAGSATVRSAASVNPSGAMTSPVASPLVNELYMHYRYLTHGGLPLLLLQHGRQYVVRLLHVNPFALAAVVSPHRPALRACFYLRRLFQAGDPVPRMLRTMLRRRLPLHMVGEVMKIVVVHSSSSSSSSCTSPDGEGVSQGMLPISRVQQRVAGEDDGLVRGASVSSLYVERGALANDDREHGGGPRTSSRRTSQCSFGEPATLSTSTTTTRTRSSGTDATAAVAAAAAHGFGVPEHASSLPSTAFNVLGYSTEALVHALSPTDGVVAAAASPLPVLRVIDPSSVTHSVMEEEQRETSVPPSVMYVGGDVSVLRRYVAAIGQASGPSSSLSEAAAAAAVNTPLAAAAAAVAAPVAAPCGFLSVPNVLDACVMTTAATVTQRSSPGRGSQRRCVDQDTMCTGVFEPLVKPLSATAHARATAILRGEGPASRAVPNAGGARTSLPLCTETVPETSTALTYLFTALREYSVLLRQHGQCVSEAMEGLLLDTLLATYLSLACDLHTASTSATPTSTSLSSLTALQSSPLTLLHALLDVGVLHDRFATGERLLHAATTVHLVASAVTVTASRALGRTASESGSADGFASERRANDASTSTAHTASHFSPQQDTGGYQQSAPSVSPSWLYGYTSSSLAATASTMTQYAEELLAVGMEMLIRVGAVRHVVHYCLAMHDPPRALEALLTTRNVNSATAAIVPFDSGMMQDMEAILACAAARVDAAGCTSTTDTVAAQQQPTTSEAASLQQRPARTDTQEVTTTTASAAAAAAECARRDYRAIFTRVSRLLLLQPALTSASTHALSAAAVVSGGRERLASTDFVGERRRGSSGSRSSTAVGGDTVSLEVPGDLREWAARYAAVAMHT